MIGSDFVSGPRPQPAAEFDPGQARQHPVEHDQVGHAFLQAGVGIVAAGDGIDLIAFGFEVVAQEQRQRLLVFDDQDPCGLSVHAAFEPRPGHCAGIMAKVVVSPFGRCSAIGKPSII